MTGELSPGSGRDPIAPGCSRQIKAWKAPVITLQYKNRPGFIWRPHLLPCPAAPPTQGRADATQPGRCHPPVVLPAVLGQKGGKKELKGLRGLEASAGAASGWHVRAVQSRGWERSWCPRVLGQRARGGKSVGADVWAGEDVCRSTQRCPALQWTQRTAAAGTGSMGQCPGSPIPLLGAGATWRREPEGQSARHALPAGIPTSSRSLLHQAAPHGTAKTWPLRCVPNPTARRPPAAGIRTGMEPGRGTAEHAGTRSLVASPVSPAGSHPPHSGRKGCRGAGEGAAALQTSAGSAAWSISPLARLDPRSRERPPLLQVPRCLRSAARSPHGAPVPGSQPGH